MSKARFIVFGPLAVIALVLGVLMPNLAGSRGSRASASSRMVAQDPTGGYWLAASDGGVFTFGGATFFGSMVGKHLNAPVIGIQSTPDGGGYWLYASDGGVFTFGDAAFFGSTGNMTLKAPVVGMAALGSAGAQGPSGPPGAPAVTYAGRIRIVSSNSPSTVSPTCTELSGLGPNPVTFIPSLTPSPPILPTCTLHVTGGFPANSQMVATLDSSGPALSTTIPGATAGDIAIVVRNGVAANTTWMVNFQIAVPPA